MNWKIKSCFVLFTALWALGSCSCGSDGGKEDDREDVELWDNSNVQLYSQNNKVIYEINVRNYSANGNFKGVENDLLRLKQTGIDILWLMPIHPIGISHRVGTKGSPYSVKDYTSIHSDYGTDADLRSLIAAAHMLGMEIWLDWVGNHTAWDHVWVTEHLDYYAEKNGQRPYSPENWTDVVQLDYNNAAMRTAMIEAMQYWVEEFDIDGFRCDAATYIPTSFWTEAKAAVNAIKPITWLCEGDDARYMTAFDYDYAWAFNTALNNFGKNGNVPTLISESKKLFNNTSYSSKGRMVYLTNHDLSAYEGTEFTRYRNYVQTLSVLYFTIYDMPLIYNGQEIGMNKTMGLFEIDPVRWTPVNTKIESLLRKLIRLKKSQPALESGANRGTLTQYETLNTNVFVYSRKRGDNEVVVMLNLSNAPVSFRFSNAVPTGTFTNYLESGTKQFLAEELQELPANGYAVYVK